MLLRDPVHGLISFEGEVQDLVLALLDTREVQRLRRIKQLGLASLVFPGAEHSRFAHAVGTAHVMSRLLQRVRSVAEILPKELRPTPELERVAIAAAMLHDLGHGPFSHLFEEVLPHARHHEAWTYAIIESKETEVHRALCRFGADMPSQVSQLLQGQHPAAWLSRWISGVIDVDRCDYLLRDSQMAGVAYGIYDLDWLLQALTFAELPGFASSDLRSYSIVIEGRKGLPPIEGFFLARHFMYSQVYHHKAARAGEVLIRALFVRVRELLEDSKTQLQVPDALQFALRQRASQPPDDGELQAYLELDEAVLQASFAAWVAHPDKLLSDLARRVRDRRLPKTLPLEQLSATESATLIARARELSDQKGLRSDLYVGVDAATDVPYVEDDADPESGLWVSLRHQPLSRLSSLSFTLERLVGARTVRERLCFPLEIRDKLLQPAT